jgi:chromosome segregation ATPase
LTLGWVREYESAVCKVKKEILDGDFMISETVLRTLQERMRRLLEISAACAARDAELRAAVERARSTEPGETAREAADVRDSERLMEEKRCLQDHINELIGSGQDPALVSDLKEELAELESRRLEIDQRIEQSRPSVENAIRELECGELEHRRVADQATRLREHIEKLSQG